MQKIKISVLGDICPTNDYKPFFKENPAALFADISHILKESDYSICNLECPATNYDKPIVKTGPNLKAEPSIVKILKDIGINAVSLANNHVLDYGVQGMYDTLETLKENNVKQFGGGKDSEDAALPLIVEIKGQKVGFLSFSEHEFNLATENTAGANWFDPYKSLNDITLLKKSCNYVIVLYHGGIEHYKLPSPLLQKKCRAIVDAGADAVFCQHSHCIGTTEEYNGKPIVYGQGNTVFGYRENSPQWNEGFLCTVILGEGKVELEYRLLNAFTNGITLASEEAHKVRFDELIKDSEVLKDPKLIKSSWDDFCKKSEALVLANVYGKSKIFNKLNRICDNRLINLLIKKPVFRVTMAYVRCESHHEVLTTILENKTND